MRSATEQRRVFALAGEGRSACEIARLTTIPRSTVRDWLRRGEPAPTCDVCGGPPHAFEELPGRDYAYLLGVYLGDGTISSERRCYRLRLTMDSRYPGVVAECVAAVRSVMPANRVWAYQTATASMTVISSYSKAWPCLFPQHGPGKKRHRKIELTGWQQALVDEHPEPLLRGLLHSDGCRVVNRVGGREYTRYFFSQLSGDIRDLFCRSCEQLEIVVTSRNPRQLSVARRGSVARLDEFVGAKT